MRYTHIKSTSKHDYMLLKGMPTSKFLSLDDCLIFFSKREKGDSCELVKIFMSCMSMSSLEHYPTTQKYN